MKKFIEEQKRAMEGYYVEGVTLSRAYVPMEHVAFAELEESGELEVKYLTTHGIGPCVGFTAYSQELGKTVTALAHFDSDNKQEIEAYLHEIQRKLPSLDSAKITLIPSKTSLAGIQGGKSVWATELLSDHAPVSGPIKEGQNISKNLYDRIHFAATRIFGEDKVILKQEKRLRDTEDVCINIRTGEVGPYIERQKVLAINTNGLK